MYLAESIINEKVKIEKSKVREKPIRSIAKAISWRITGSLDTLLIAWFFTSNVNTAMAIGLTEVLTKTLLYYVHERTWSGIQLGVD